MSVFLSALFLLNATCAEAQDTTTVEHYTRNVIYTTPVRKTTTINGVALGIMAIPTHRRVRDPHLYINGLNVELGPMGAVGGLYGVIGTLFSPIHTKASRVEGPLADSRKFPEDNTHATVIRGISLSGGGLIGETSMRGISINGLTSLTTDTYGLEITGLVNMHYRFHGLMIAGLRNKTTTGKGVQIALINTCKSGKLVQIGVINRIGRRITPIVNCSFKGG